MNKTERRLRARSARGPKRKRRKDRQEKPQGDTVTLTASYVTDGEGKFLRQVSGHRTTIS